MGKYSSYDEFKIDFTDKLNNDLDNLLEVFQNLGLVKQDSANSTLFDAIDLTKIDEEWIWQVFKDSGSTDQNLHSAWLEYCFYKALPKISIENKNIFNIKEFDIPKIYNSLSDDIKKKYWNKIASFKKDEKSLYDDYENVKAVLNYENKKDNMTTPMAIFNTYKSKNSEYDNTKSYFDNLDNVLISDDQILSLLRNMKTNNILNTKWVTQTTRGQALEDAYLKFDVKNYEDLKVFSNDIKLTFSEKSLYKNIETYYNALSLENKKKYFQAKIKEYVPLAGNEVFYYDMINLIIVGEYNKKYNLFHDLNSTDLKNLAKIINEAGKNPKIENIIGPFLISSTTYKKQLAKVRLDKAQEYLLESFKHLDLSGVSGKMKLAIIDWWKKLSLAEVGRILFFAALVTATCLAVAYGSPIVGAVGMSLILFQGVTIGGGFLIAAISQFYKDHYLGTSDELEVSIKISKNETLTENDLKRANREDLHIAFYTLFNLIDSKKIETFLQSEKPNLEQLTGDLSKLHKENFKLLITYFLKSPGVMSNLKSYIHNYAMTHGKISQEIK